MSRNKNIKQGTVMLLSTPQCIARNIVQKNDIVFDMQRDKIQYLVNNYHCGLDRQTRDLVGECIYEHTDIIFTPDQLEQFLYLFPVVRINAVMNRSNGNFDTEIVKQIMDAVSTLFIGCSWPTYGDAREIPNITEIISDKIKEQAKLMGYHVNEKRAV
jgi:hypothetical protein